MNANFSASNRVAKTFATQTTTAFKTAKGELATINARLQTYNKIQNSAIGLTSRQVDEVRKLERRYKEVENTVKGLDKVGYRKQIKNTNELARELKKTQSEYDKLNKRLRSGTNLSDAQSISLKRASDRLKVLRVEARDAGISVQTLGTKFNFLEKTLLRIGVLFAGRELYRGIKSIINVTRDMESTLISVQKTTDFNAEQIQKYKDGIFDLGKTTGVAVDNLARIGVVAGQLGVGEEGVQAVSDFTEIVAKATVALDEFGGNSEVVATQVAKQLNAFGLTTASAESYLSSMNALTNTTAANAVEISSFNRNFAGTARALKITFQESNALGATLIAMGQAGDDAGTRLSSAFDFAIKNLDKVAEAVGKTEAELQDLIREDTVGGFLEILKLIGAQGDFLKNNTVLTETYGRIGAKVTRQLINSHSVYNKNLQTSTEASRILIGTQSSIEAEFQKANASFNAEIERTKNSLKALADTTGTKLLPVLSKLLIFLQKLTNSSDGLFPLLRTAIFGVVGALGVSGLLSTLAFFVPAITLALSPLGLLATALIAAGGGAIIMRNSFEEAQKSMADVQSSVDGHISELERLADESEKNAERRTAAEEAVTKAKKEQLEAQNNAEKNSLNESLQDQNKAKKETLKLKEEELRLILSAEEAVKVGLINQRREIILKTSELIDALRQQVIDLGLELQRVTDGENFNLKNFLGEFMGKRVTRSINELIKERNAWNTELNRVMDMENLYGKEDIIKATKAARDKAQSTLDTRLEKQLKLTSEIEKTEQRISGIKGGHYLKTLADVELLKTKKAAELKYLEEVKRVNSDTSSEYKNQLKEVESINGELIKAEKTLNDLKNNQADGEPIKVEVPGVDIDLTGLLNSSGDIANIISTKIKDEVEKEPIKPSLDPEGLNKPLSKVKEKVKDVKESIKETFEENSDFAHNSIDLTEKYQESLEGVEKRLEGVKGKLQDFNDEQEKFAKRNQEDIDNFNFEAVTDFVDLIDTNTEKLEDLKEKIIEADTAEKKAEIQAEIDLLKKEISKGQKFLDEFKKNTVTEDSSFEDKIGALEEKRRKSTTFQEKSYYQKEIEELEEAEKKEKAKEQDRTNRIKEQIREIEKLLSLPATKEKIEGLLKKLDGLREKLKTPSGDPVSDDLEEKAREKLARTDAEILNDKLIQERKVLEEKQIILEAHTLAELQALDGIKDRRNEDLLQQKILKLLNLEEEKNKQLELQDTVHLNFISKVDEATQYRKDKELDVANFAIQQANKVAEAYKKAKSGVKSPQIDNGTKHTGGIADFANNAQRILARKAGYGRNEVPGVTLLKGERVLTKSQTRAYDAMKNAKPDFRGINKVLSKQKPSVNNDNKRSRNYKKNVSVGQIVVNNPIANSIQEVERITKNWY